MYSIVVFHKSVLDINYISELSIDYLFKLDPGGRVQKIMLLVCFLDFGGGTGQKSYSVCYSSCIEVIAFEDEIELALFDESIVLITKPIIILVRFRSFAIISKGSKSRAKSKRHS